MQIKNSLVIYLFFLKFYRFLFRHKYNNVDVNILVRTKFWFVKLILYIFDVHVIVNRDKSLIIKCSNSSLEGISSFHVYVLLWLLRVAMLRVAHARNDVNCRWKLD